MDEEYTWQDAYTWSPGDLPQDRVTALLGRIDRVLQDARQPAAPAVAERRLNGTFPAESHPAFPTGLWQVIPAGWGQYGAAEDGPCPWNPAEESEAARRYIVSRVKPPDDVTWQAIQRQRAPTETWRHATWTPVVAPQDLYVVTGV